jgi:TnpA family transposase
MSNMIDVVYSQNGGQHPDVIISDASWYSDLVFGLVHLLDMEYRPALTDLPNHKGWRINARAATRCWTPSPVA